MLSRLRTTLTEIVRRPYSLYVMIALVGIVAYGLFITKLGFYWDDWPWVWRAHVQGAQGMLKIDEHHRPLTGIVLYLGALLAGETPALWQLYTLTLRLLSAIALAWILKKLWHDNLLYITGTAFLFLLYPGFSQQFVSVNSSRHIFPLITFFLSLGFTLKNLQEKKHKQRNIALALLLSLATMLTTEYYYGLELARPVLIWLQIQRTEKHPQKSLVKSFKSWLPYALLVTVIFGWRYSVSKETNYSITLLEQISGAKTGGILHLLQNIASDLYIASIGAWGKIFDLTSLRTAANRIQLYYVVVAITSLIGTLSYLALLPLKKQNARQKEIFILGLATLIISPLPFWVTGLAPGLGFPPDRLLLPSALGASLLLVAIIDTLLRHPVLKVMTLATIVGLTAGNHTLNAVTYRTAWASTSSFFQQLSTRAPSLPPNTTILSNQLPGRSTDNSLIAPLNWSYAPNFTDESIPFQLLYVDLRFGRDETVVDENLFQLKYYMQYPFKGSSEQVLGVFYEPPACLQIVDAQNGLRKIPEPIDAVLPYSRPEIILSDAGLQAKPPAFFAPAHKSPTWCDYFQKADLARQQRDWETVAQLGDTAFATGKEPNHPSELIPFIEGYAHTGNWDKAVQLTLDAPERKSIFCTAWARIQAETSTSTEREAALSEIKEKLTCNF